MSTYHRTPSKDKFTAPVARSQLLCTRARTCGNTECGHRESHDKTLACRKRNCDHVGGNIACVVSPIKRKGNPNPQWVYDIRSKFPGEDLGIIQIMELFHETSGKMAESIKILEKEFGERSVTVLAPVDYGQPPRRF